jgi:hypothetical protein
MVSGLLISLLQCIVNPCEFQPCQEEDTVEVHDILNNITLALLEFVGCEIKFVNAIGNDSARFWRLKPEFPVTDFWDSAEIPGCKVAALLHPASFFYKKSLIEILKEVAKTNSLISGVRCLLKHFLHKLLTSGLFRLIYGNDNEVNENVMDQMLGAVRSSLKSEYSWYYCAETWADVKNQLFSLELLKEHFDKDNWSINLNPKFRSKEKMRAIINSPIRNTMDTLTMGEGWITAKRKASSFHHSMFIQ